MRERDAFFDLRPICITPARTIRRMLPAIGLFVLCSCKNDTKKSTEGQGADYLSQPAQIITSNDFLPGNFRDPEQIRQIQKSVNVLTSLSITDSAVLEDEDFLENMTDGGSTLTGYFSNGELIKISEWVGLSYGVIQQHFYFAKERLVFVSQTEDYFYTDTAGTDHSKFENDFRSEFYFTAEKLLEQVSSGSRRFNEEKDKEAELLTDAFVYRKLLQSKKNKH
jgi:hypothetical protein